MGSLTHSPPCWPVKSMRQEVLIALVAFSRLGTEQVAAKNESWANKDHGMNEIRNAKTDVIEPGNDGPSNKTSAQCAKLP